MHVVYKRCSLIISTVSISIVDLLTVEPHTPTHEPVQYDKKDGQWYGHDGVDVKDTQGRKGNMSSLLKWIRISLTQMCACLYCNDYFLEEISIVHTKFNTEPKLKGRVREG